MTTTDILRAGALCGLLAVLITLGAGPPPARIALGQAAQFACLEFETELTSLSLTGGPFPMPLAGDPGNSLGDSIDG